MSKRQKFTKEFRAESVELFLSSDKSLVELAASLGINEGTLGNWVRTTGPSIPRQKPRNGARWIGPSTRSCSRSWRR